jgi:hypothetical protein
VNVAARLEQICPPGDMLMSGAADDHLAGKIDTKYAGELQLKNMSRPIKAPLSGSTFVSSTASTSWDQQSPYCPSRISPTIRIKSIQRRHNRRHHHQLARFTELM